MAIRRLESCCCCCDLKSGVLVIGILSIVLAVGGLIQAPIAYNTACSGHRTVDNNKECAKASSQLGSSISSEIIGIILMSLTIYGSQAENYRFMLPAIILQAIGLVIMSIVFWYLIIIFFMFSAGYGFLVLFLTHLILAFCVYFWLVMYSRCEEIKNMSYTAADIA